MLGANLFSSSFLSIGYISFSKKKKKKSDIEKCNRAIVDNLASNSRIDILGRITFDIKLENDIRLWIFEQHNQYN